MAKINNTAAYATATPNADSIVIGSTESGGDTKNFLMSAISTFVLGNAVTPTLDDVCQQGNTTTTSIQINNVGGLSILTGPLTSNGSTFLLGSSTVINGTVDINNTADIADTLTLSKATGLGLQVDSDVNIDDRLTVGSFTTINGAIDANSTADIADTLTLSKATGTGLQVDSNANVDGRLDVNGALTANNVLNAAGSFLLSSTPPASSSDTGQAGQIAVDATHVYVCVGTNSWGRVAIDITPF